VRVLVVGGGGREHALCWALKRDHPHATLFAAPGNPGTAQLGTNLAIAATAVADLVTAARQHSIDFAVIGPEAPLAAGLADALRAAGTAVLGPSAAAARLEASKAFAKEVMARAGVPTAASRSFTALDPALAYIRSHAEPLVVKASGLAAGKGAVLCDTRAAAAASARAMLAEGSLGEAGREIVIEQFLAGEELSVLALTDGERVAILPPAQDHKRLGEGDTGPNTGGMGAYCPVSLATPALLERVRREVLEPTLREMAVRRTPYAGVLYAGLMISADGTPSGNPGYSPRAGSRGQRAVPGHRAGRVAAQPGGACRRARGGHDGPRRARLSGRARTGRRHRPAGEPRLRRAGVPRRHGPRLGRHPPDGRRPSARRHYARPRRALSRAPQRRRLRAHHL